MRPLLDDQYTDLEGDDVQGEITKHIRLRSGLYLLIMILGGMVYHRYYYGNFGLSNSIYFAVVITSFCIFISLILEIFRLYIRKIKPTKNNIMDPVWFLILEGGFSVWLLLFLLIFISQFI